MWATTQSDRPFRHHDRGNASLILPPLTSSAMNPPPMCGYVFIPLDWNNLISDRQNLILSSWGPRLGRSVSTHLPACKTKVKLTTTPCQINVWECGACIKQAVTPIRSASHHFSIASLLKEEKNITKHQERGGRFGRERTVCSCNSLLCVSRQWWFASCCVTTWVVLLLDVSPDIVVEILVAARDFHEDVAEVYSC
jgi:hypothetical protein